MKVPHFDIEIKSYTKKEIRVLYNVTQDVLRRWLKPFEKDLPNYNPNARIFTPAQVRVIFEKLGEP
jgi:Domain of unknown function (DUF4248)